MRRAGPILIAVIGVLALIIDFFPGLRLPDPAAGDGQWRRRDEARPGPPGRPAGRVPGAAARRPDPDAEAMGDIRDIIENRMNQTGVSEPVVDARARTASSSRSRASPTSSRPPARRPTGRLDFVPLGTTQAHGGPGPRPRADPPLFGGDQIISAAIGQDRNGGLAVDFTAQERAEVAAELFSQLHARPRRRVLRHRPRRRRHLGPVINEPIPGTAQVQITRAASAASRRRGQRAWSRSSSSARCRSRSRRSQRADQRDARRAVPRSDLLAGVIGIAPGVRLHAPVLPAAGRRRLVRAHLLHARRLRASSGSSR